VVQTGLCGPNSCLEPETGKADVMGSESNDWLVHGYSQQIEVLYPNSFEYVDIKFKISYLFSSAFLFP
jgi:hypothetical protein